MTRSIKKNYFQKLFESMSNHYAGDEELQSPEELKQYLINTLTSNVQYDFGIDYNASDVVDFARAIITDYQKDKSVIDIIDDFDYETSIKIADALYCKFAFENLKKKVSKETKLEMYSLADYVYSKDQTGISKSACLDAIVQFVNEGEKLSDLVNMDKWKLLNKIHEAEDF